jgi:hypothetical protein
MTVWQPLEVWKYNAFSSTFSTKIVHFLRMLKCDLCLVLLITYFWQIFIYLFPNLCFWQCKISIKNINYPYPPIPICLRETTVQQKHSFMESPPRVKGVLNRSNWIEWPISEWSLISLIAERSPPSRVFSKGGYIVQLERFLFTMCFHCHGPGDIIQKFMHW